MVDITKNYHKTSFPIKIASANGQNGHVFNMILMANGENGDLGLKGNYRHYDQYETNALAALSNGFEGVIRDTHPTGEFEVEVTALPSDGTVVYLYQSPVSPYPNVELQDERLWYNAKDDVVQGMTLGLHDVFAVSTEGFTGTPVVGKTVTYASGKYVVGA